jgi:hypothetical protein
LRELAKSHGKLSMYELHYRPWCRQVHVTNTIVDLSLDEDDEVITIRPIRRPHGIHDVVRSAGLLAISLAGGILGKYGSDDDALKRYKDLDKGSNK